MEGRAGARSRRGLVINLDTREARTPEPRCHAARAAMDDQYG